MRKRKVFHKNERKFGFTISSRGDDNNPYCLFHFNRTTWELVANKCIIPPYKYTWTYGDNVHNMIAARELTATLTLGEYGNYFYFRWGADNDFVSGDTKLPGGLKIFNIPWMGETFQERYTLDVRGEKYDGSFPEHVVTFSVLDNYDGALIDVTAKIEKSIFTKGTGSFAWLKRFYKPREYYRLELEFSQELGKGKDTWKGGTLASSIYLENFTSLADAITKWGEDTGHEILKYKSGERT